MDSHAHANPWRGTPEHDLAPKTMAQPRRGRCAPFPRPPSQDPTNWAMGNYYCDGYFPDWNSIGFAHPIVRPQLLLGPDLALPAGIRFQRTISMAAARISRITGGIRIAQTSRGRAPTSDNRIRVWLCCRSRSCKTIIQVIATWDRRTRNRHSRRLPPCRRTATHPSHCVTGRCKPDAATTPKLVIRNW